MAVALDAKLGFGSSHNALTTFTDTAFTVGSGSNRVLVVALSVEVSSGSPPTTPTANWDSTGTNQSMSLIHTQSDSNDPNISSYLFGLVAPTSGNKTLSIAALTSTSDSLIAYISFTGADQTGGTTTFKNATGSIASATSITETPTANSGDAVVAVFGGNDGTPSVNQTSWSAATLTTLTTDYWIANYALATGSMSMTMTQGSTAFCNGNAMVINQAASGVALNQQTLVMM